MTKDEIIRMAREAKFNDFGVAWQMDAMTRFAALVAEAEREVCAKVCDSEMFRETSNPDNKEVAGIRLGARFCAAAIRARSNT